MEPDRLLWEGAALSVEAGRHSAAAEVMAPFTHDESRHTVCWIKLRIDCIGRRWRFGNPEQVAGRHLCNGQPALAILTYATVKRCNGQL